MGSRSFGTSDGTGEPLPQCYYAAFGCSTPAFDTVRLSDPRTEADHYLQVGFSGGTLDVGGVAALDQLAIRSEDGTTFDEQSDDYSFKNQSAFADNLQVTVYVHGELLWGAEPKPVPVVEALSVQYATGDQELQNNVMKPFVQVVNTGNVPLERSNVTVRYWFSRDTESEFDAYCDYAQIGCDRVNLSIVPVTGRPGVDAYLEVAFDPGQVDVDDSSGPIEVRVQRSDWGQLDESNDYSHGTNPVFESSTKVTAYLRGELVWGSEP